ncbi:MFS-type transporter SLC18B1-like [Ornithodoros turicata]|uniref:MFS-type transporter SLC18B1-like n=1 Tax=Ornithodoros turicata TaxID=34597 RepID=UPI00313A4487
MSAYEKMKDEPTPRCIPWTKRRVTILAIVCSINVLLGSRYSILAPFFPHEAARRGNTATQYGFVFGIYAVTSFLTAPLFGKLLSCNVPAKGMYCVGVFVDALSCCFMGLLEFCPMGNTFFVMALLIRAVMALGFTASYTCACAIVAAEFPENAVVFIPLLETTLGLGIIVGPTVGGMLYEIGGYMLPFVAMGSTQILAAVVATIYLPQIEKPEEADTVNMKDVLDGRVFVDLLVTIASFYTMGFNDETLAVHLQQRDPRCVALLAPAMLLPCYAIIGPLPFIPFHATLPLVCISQALVGAGMAAYFMPAFVHSLQQAVEVKKLPSNVATFGLLSGLFTSAVCFGCFIGPIAAGVLVDHVGFRWATLFTFNVHIVVCIVLVAAILYDRFFVKDDCELEPLVERSDSLPDYSDLYGEKTSGMPQ